MSDALIIGAGPAGASCALWLARLGLNPLVADARGMPGGLLNDSPFRNDWIATQPGVTGPDLAEGIGLALAAAQVPLLLGMSAVSAERRDGGFAVAFESAEGKRREVQARFLVLATGVRAKSGGVPPAPNVLIGPGAHVAAYDFAGKSVAILGGGDNAFENHAFVRGKGAREAHIYARGIRAGRAFIANVDAGDVRRGPYTVDAAAMRVNDRAYDVLLVMYGWEPRPIFPGLDLDRDSDGFIRTHPVTAETSAEGVYAIGEVARRGHPSVVTALADGVTAAKAIQRRIEAEPA